LTNLLNLNVMTTFFFSPPHRHLAVSLSAAGCEPAYLR
jgi:hypothetical protein